MDSDGEGKPELERGGSIVINRGSQESDSSPSSKESTPTLKRSGVTFAADVPRPTSPEPRPQYNIDESKPLYFRVHFPDNSLDVPTEVKVVSVRWNWTPQEVIRHIQKEFDLLSPPDVALYVPSKKIFLDNFTSLINVPVIREAGEGATVDVEYRNQKRKLNLRADIRRRLLNKEVSDHQREWADSFKSTIKKKEEEKRRQEYISRMMPEDEVKEIQEKLNQLASPRKPLARASSQANVMKGTAQMEDRVRKAELLVEEKDKQLVEVAKMGKKLMEEKNRLASHVEALQTSYEKIEEEYEQLGEANYKLESKCTMLESQLDEVTMSYHSLTGAMGDKERELEKTRKQHLQDIRRHEQQLEDDLEIMKESLSKSEEEREKIEREYKRLHERAAEVESKLKATEDLLENEKNFSLEAKRLRKENSAMKRKTEQIQAELIRHREEAENTQAPMGEVWQRLQQLLEARVVSPQDELGVLESLDQTIENLRKRMEEGETISSQLEQLLSSHMSQIENISEDIQRIERMGTDASSIYLLFSILALRLEAHMEEKLQEVTEKSQHLEEELKEVEIRLEETKEENEQLKIDATPHTGYSQMNLMDQLNLGTAEAPPPQKDILLERNRTLESKLVEVQGERDKLEAEVGNLQEKERLALAAAQELERLQGELQKMSTEKSQLEGTKEQIKNLQALMEQEKTQLEEERTQKEKLEKTLEEERSRMEELERLQDEMKPEKTQLEEDIKRLEGEKSQLEGEIKRLEDKVSQKEISEKELEDDNSRLRKQLEESSTKEPQELAPPIQLPPSDEHIRKIEEISNERDRYQKELERMSTEKNQLGRTNTEQEETIKRLQREISDKQKKDSAPPIQLPPSDEHKERIRQLQEEMSKEKEELERMNSEQEETIKRLQREISDKQKKEGDSTSLIQLPPSDSIHFKKSHFVWFSSALWLWIVIELFLLMFSFSEPEEVWSGTT